MMSYQRPKAITAILNTINAGDNTALASELSEYITMLESHQPERPQEINDILETVAETYAPTMRASLALYLTELESSQVPSQQYYNLGDEPTSSAQIWSHSRQQQRAQQRKSRALRKQNGYSK